MQLAGTWGAHVPARGWPISRYRTLPQPWAAPLRLLVPVPIRPLIGMRTSALEACGNRSSRFVTALLSFLALALFGPGLSSSEAAPPSPASVLAGCPDGAACLFEDINGGGEIYIITYPNQDSTLHNNLCQCCISSKHPNSNNTWGDQASSYQNRTGHNYCVYADTNFNNLLFIMSSTQVNVTNVPSGTHDEASSIKPC